MNIFSHKLSTNGNSSKLGRGYIFIFFLIFLYWVYLVLTTTPILAYDALGYESAGRFLMEKGWIQYFVTGPNREPLFPLIVSWSMALEQWIGWPYPVFCKIFLLSFYALTIAGVYQLIMMMGARRNTAAWACIYLGISPAILNSTLWMWSEAASYPWVVGIILASVKIWQSVVEAHKTVAVMRSAACLSVMFFMLTMVKAMASVIFMVYLLPFFGVGLYYAFKKDIHRLGRVFLAVLIMAGIYFIAIEEYKNLNYRYNGHYAITFQSPGVLFGNTVRRLTPLTKDRLIQAVLFVPRLGFCQHFYKEDCIFWGCEYSDEITKMTTKKMQDLGFNYQQKQGFFMSESLRLFGKHPFQEFFMSCLEATKMFFWETKLFFVNYPRWLDRLYCTPFIVYGLSFTWSLLSVSGLIFGINRSWRLRKSKEGAAFLFTTSFVLCFMACYSLFFIDLRYALPIAPLFVALSFVWLEKLLPAAG